MSTSTLRILIVEDSPTDAELLVRSLRAGLKTPFECDHVERLDQAIAHVEEGRIGLIITDLNLPDSEGLDTFEQLQSYAGDIPIVILSGNEDIELAVESVRRGAQDYVVKGASTSQSLGHCVRFAIERGRRIQAERERDQATRDLQIAHDIQKSLYPSEGLKLPGYDIAGAAWSAEQACGDYYDFFQIPDGRYALAVADVCGHGLPAALMTLQLRSCLRLLARQGASAGEVIAGVHREILHEDSGKRRFASLFYAILDPTTGVLEYASGGHAGLLLRVDGSHQVLDPTATIVGMLDDICQDPDQTINLNSGDTLVLATDGFQEATFEKRELFGTDRLIEAVREAGTRSSAGIIQRIHDAVELFSDAEAQLDDMTAVVVTVA